MRYIERTLTRDSSLMAIQAWYEGGTTSYDDFLGFPIRPERVYIYRNGTFEFWDDTDRLHSSLAKEIARTLKADKKRKYNIYHQIVKSLNFLREARDKEYAGVEETLKYLEDAMHFFSLGFTGVFIMHWLPIINKEFLKKGEKVFDEEDIEKIMEWRKKEGDVFYNEGVTTIYSLLAKIAEKKKWDKQLLNYLTFSELRETVKNSKQLPLETIEKRRNSVFAYLKNKVVFEQQLDSELKKIGYQMKKEAVEDIKTLEGSIANRGYAKGRVRKIFNRSQVSDIEKGEVLVAPMTSAWYTPALEKASAIVTDEGGITCHAAIISREMEKPCIVGTRIATRALKDGDLVEVDAEKGIVRKLG